MSVFPLPVHFTENKTDESPNNTGKAKSYPDDGGIRHFLLPEKKIRRQPLQKTGI